MSTYGLSSGDILTSLKTRVSRKVQERAASGAYYFIKHPERNISDNDDEDIISIIFIFIQCDRYIKLDIS